MTTHPLEAGTATFAQADATPIFPAAWEERFVQVRTLFIANGLGAGDLRETARELTLADPQGVPWRYDGARWERKEGARWLTGTPAGPLRLQPFSIDLLLPPDGDFDPGADARSLVAARRGNAPPPAAAPPPPAARPVTGIGAAPPVPGPGTSQRPGPPGARSPAPPARAPSPFGRRAGPPAAESPAPGPGPVPVPGPVPQGLACGHDNPPGARFCRICGQRAAAPPPAIVGPAAFAAPPPAPPAAAAPALPAVSTAPAGGNWVCAACGTASDPAHRFCRQCGTARPQAPVAAPRCASCGDEFVAGARFCRQCGLPRR